MKASILVNVATLVLSLFAVTAQADDLVMAKNQAMSEPMSDGMSMTARYRVDFERTWSSDTHRKDFPLLAHFSPVIGVTQARGYELIQSGARATSGLESLCEQGKHQPLDAEIKAAMASGQVGALIETSDPLRDVPQTAMAEFEIDTLHPTVTIAAMIAPSPDWCAVATDVVLVQDGKFEDRVSAELVAWDMGTDSATSYRALDKDSQPREPIMPSASPYFRNGENGAANPVGRVTFTRLP
jgi:hypothetical protein